jgi:hypothetical protein
VRAGGLSQELAHRLFAFVVGAGIEIGIGSPTATA